MRSYCGIGGVCTQNGNLKKYIKYIKSKKQRWIVVLGALIGGVILMLSGLQKEDNAPLPQSDEQSMMQYEEYIEQRITKLCESVKGVSHVQVMVTLDGGFENVYARDEAFLTVGSGSSKSPVLIKQVLPAVRGVGIVCDRADDPIVQREICELLSSALGISSNRIYIAKGK